MSEERLLEVWDWQARQESLSRWLDDEGRGTTRYYVQWDRHKPTDLSQLDREETRRSYNHTIDLCDWNACMYGRLAITAIKHGDVGKARLWAILAANEANRASYYEGLLEEVKRGES